MSDGVQLRYPNKTPNVDDYSSVVICVIYLFIGTISILFNIFNIYVFARKKSLRKKYIVFIFLEFAEIVNGTAYIMTGAGRLSSTANGQLQTEITAKDCFFTKPWPIIVLVGTQLPALIVVFGSIERTIAIHQPSHYYWNWNYGYKLKRLSLLIIVQMVSIIVAARSSYGLLTLNPSQHCTTIESTHIVYSSAHFLLVILAYVGSFLTLFSIFRSKRGYNRVDSSSFRQGIKKESNIRVLMITSLICIVFTSIPALTNILDRWEVIDSGEFILGISLVPPGFISIGRTIVNCVFHNDYRTHVIRIFCPSKNEKMTGRTNDDSEEKEYFHENSLILGEGTQFRFTNNGEVML